MANFDRRLVTTAFDLSGYRIESNLGLVRGIVVRSRSLIGNIGAGLQTLIGGNITLYTELCEKARSDAFQLMIEHASEMGANAIIGVRYDANEVHCRCDRSVVLWNCGRGLAKLNGAFRFHFATLAAQLWMTVMGTTVCSFVVMFMRKRPSCATS
jgi:uncharacterized protein YbjQ (UPF0145 family)